MIRSAEMSTEVAPHADKRLYAHSEYSCSKCLYIMRQDTFVPVTAAQWLANNLRDCSLTVCKDATHQMYIMREPLAQVCEQIAAAAPFGLLSST